MENLTSSPKQKEPIEKIPYRGIYIGWALFFVIIFSAFSGAVFGFIAGGFGNKLVNNLAIKFPGILNENNKSVAKNDPVVSRENVVEEDSAIIDLVKKTSPAVVSIAISKDISKLQNTFFDPFGFFDNGSGATGNGQNNSGGGSTQKEKIGGGTGFLITADGMIVTNKHVVSDETADYTVMTSDGKNMWQRFWRVIPLTMWRLLRLMEQIFLH